MKTEAALAGDSAARHLLHNLRNAQALRENPLVWHLIRSDELHPAAEPLADRFVISRVAQAVASVLRDLAPAEGNPFDAERCQRQSEIVRRCIIGTEPYKAVAHDLGISLRTLFRDLDTIRLRLAEDLPRFTPAVVSVASATDTFELQLRHSHLLRNMGRFDEALAVLERLSAEAGSQVQRARAWNSSAMALVDSGKTDRASHNLGRARSTLASATTEPEAAKSLTTADVDLTDAVIARVNGDTAAAMRYYDRASGAARPLLSESFRDAADVYVRAQAQSAIINWLVGNIGLSAQAIERGWNILERVNDPPETGHYSLLSASALVHLVVDGDVAWAIREMSAAAVLAERRGMLHDSLMSLGYLASLERLNGNLTGALATSRRTMAIARNSMAGTEFGLLCANAAEIESESGHADMAMALVKEGRARVQPGGSAWARLTIGEAQAHLAAGKTAEAVVAAQHAGEAMQRQGKAVFVGLACLLRALAHERRGERAQALLAAREALPLLERFGKSPELAAAYDLSARLTGNRRHHAAAYELRTLLKRSAR